MEIVYTGEDLPQTIVKSIFLAGPSLRPDQQYELVSWRDEALKYLADKGFEGTVFVPENRGGNFSENFDYDSQVEWEEECLNVADCIVFWVPRDLSINGKGHPIFPAFTTNVEWGVWCDSGKVVFGAPPEAPKNTYLKYYADKYNVPISDTLGGTLEFALDRIGDGVERVGGERYVPLFIWNLESFQAWYKTQINAGNRLERAKLLFNFRPRFKDFVFLWVLHAEIYVAAEDRIKDNEFVLSRPDISSVCLWYSNKDNDLSILEKQIIIVREFRTPASTEDGFIRELPSGSAPEEKNLEEVAAVELHEETGFYLKPSRLKEHMSRQLMGTLSSHKAHLFSAELSEEELEWFRSQNGIVHGKEEDTERTFIEIYSVKEILEKNLFDWSTLGMIFQALES